MSDIHDQVAALLAQSARAVELRKAGLSYRAAASATGLQLREVRKYCAGAVPLVQLPDLPGLPSLRETHPDVISKIRQMLAEGRSVSDTARMAGVCADTVRRYAPDLTAQAVNLRMRGLSPLSVASALGMSYEAALDACSGITPPITLPDLPGVCAPSDIAAKKHPSACPDSVIVQIRQMRADRYSRAHIARELGLSVATVSKYAPIGPNTKPAGADGRVKMTPETHREIHRLRFVEHMGYDKIAANMGLSVDTVRRYAKIDPQ